MAIAFDTGAFDTGAFESGAASQEVLPTGIASSEVFGTAVLTFAPLAINPQGIVSDEAFGMPLLTKLLQVVVPNGIASALTFGTPTLTKLLQIIYPSGIPSAESCGTDRLIKKDENNLMNQLYDLARERFATAQLDWTAGTIKAVLIDTSQYTLNLAHQFLSDVPGGARVAVSPNLTGRTMVLGACDAGDLTFPNVAAGPTCSALILYVHTGNEATSLLIAYLDGVGFPISPGGGNVVIQWHNGIDRIFRV